MANWIIPAIHLATSVVSLFIHRPPKANPTLEAITIRQQAEQSVKEALDTARGANELARKIKEDADREREQTRLRQEGEKEAAAKAARDIEQMKVQMEAAAAAARNAEELRRAADQAASEDRERLAREAEEERKRWQQKQEEIQREVEAMKQKADKDQRAADEQRRRDQAATAHAEEQARKAAEEARKANEAKKEAEERLKKGIQPKITPTLEELAAVKKRVQYKENYFHFAIVGISGSGKSSLVNAFRGLGSKDAGAAAVGVTEKTLQMTRYQDVNPENPYVWYDVPGAGTLKCPDWQYFHDQGLYVFDCIIVLFDNRFTMTDVAILTNARRFNIPTYVVRSKADQHIRNIMMEMGYDSEDEDKERRSRLQGAARKQFIDETRKNIKDNLQNANLADQRVYIVSNNALLNVVLNKMPKKAIDEVDLISDLVNEAYRRRHGNESTSA